MYVGNFLSEELKVAQGGGSLKKPATAPKITLQELCCFFDFSMCVSLIS